MEINVKKGDNNKFTAEVKLPAEEVKKMLDEALAHEAEHIEIKGFRKGKAPLNIVKENIDAAKLRSHALNHFLPEAYSRIVKENKIQPIIDPRFEIIQFEEGKELIINVVLVERPTVTLKDYKTALTKKAKEKKKAIKETPKKEDGSENEDTAEDKKQPEPKSDELSNEEIIEVVSEYSEVGLADLMIEEEANRMLQNLIDQLGQMGLNIDQYLTTVKKKPDEVRKEYLEIAQQTLHADFAVTEIAIKEGYTVDDTEIDATIAAVPDDKSRELLSKPEQRAYIRAVLTKSKTLTKLAELAKNETSKDNSQKENK